MNNYQEADKLIADAKNIVVLQADNPDGDSLGSSLALEAILSEKGKNVHMVCAVNIPAYLQHLKGWARVQNDIPNQFDLSIIVDTSTESLFENFNKNGSFAWVKSKPCIVIDHHTETEGLEFASTNINEKAAATSEVIYRMAKKLKWPLPIDACEMMTASIMSDSLGLISESASAETIRVVADLVEEGVSLAKLDSNRRETMQKDPTLLSYKGELLQRVKYDDSGKIAYVTIPWKEIEKYSPLYNPSMLVMDDIRLVEGVDLVIAYKTYPDGKITGKIRCNYGKGIASKLAENFGGGGHPYASGFKITNNTNLEETIKSVNSKALELLEKIEDQKSEII